MASRASAQKATSSLQRRVAGTRRSAPPSVQVSFPLGFQRVQVRHLVPLARSVSACPYGPSLCRPEASACAHRRVNNFIEITVTRREPRENRAVQAPRVDAAPPTDLSVVLASRSNHGPQFSFSACCCPFAFHGLHAERGKDKERPTRSADWTAGLHDTTHPPTTWPKPLQWSSHPHTTHPHTSHTHTHTLPRHTHTHHHHHHPPPPPHHTPHHTTAHSSRASGNRRRKCRRSAQKEPLGGDEVPFHQEVGALCRNHTAAWSCPHVPAMRSARVPFRVGKLRLVRSNRHPPREFGKHTKEKSQKPRRRAPPHNIDTPHR